MDKTEEITEQQTAETEEVTEKPVTETETTPENETVEVVETIEQPAETDTAVEALTAQIEQLQTENAELQKQLTEAQEQLATAKTTQETATAEVNTTKEKADNYEKALEKVVAEKAEGIPDDVKALMPEGISISEQLDWLVKAEKLSAKEEKPVVTIGQPTPVTEKMVDESELSVTQKMSNYFGTMFTK